MPASGDDFKEENEQMQESEEIVETEYLSREKCAEDVPTQPQPGPSISRSASTRKKNERVYDAK